MPRRQAIAWALCLTTAAAVARGQDDPHVDAPRVTGTLTFTCTPDPKTKAAGATPFDDTLDIAADRVTSKALKAEGFPTALAIPKVVNGVTTFNVTFKKKGATAKYFVRAKPDGTVTGSLTRNDGGGKSRRYTIGATGSREAAEEATTKPAAADLALDPGVLRVNGGFVRLMSVQAAMADAGVRADKAKVAAILKAAGEDQNNLRIALLKRQITPKQYVEKAGARLNNAQDDLRALAGDKAPRVESAYAAPFASGYVYLNQMRAAVADAGAPAEAAKRADQAVVQSLIELTTLAKDREQLTPEAVDKLKERARAGVQSALNGEALKRFERVLDGLASYGPAAPAEGAAGKK